MAIMQGGERACPHTSSAATPLAFRTLSLALLVTLLSVCLMRCWWEQLYNN